MSEFRRKRIQLTQSITFNVQRSMVSPWFEAKSLHLRCWEKTCTTFYLRHLHDWIHCHEGTDEVPNAVAIGFHISSRLATSPFSNLASLSSSKVARYWYSFLAIDFKPFSRESPVVLTSCLHTELAPSTFLRSVYVITKRCAPFDSW